MTLKECIRTLVLEFKEELSFIVVFYLNNNQFHYKEGTTEFIIKHAKETQMTTGNKY